MVVEQIHCLSSLLQHHQDSLLQQLWHLQQLLVNFTIQVQQSSTIDFLLQLPTPATSLNSTVGAEWSSTAIIQNLFLCRGQKWVGKQTKGQKC
jgi:hypothetical protein